MEEASDSSRGVAPLINNVALPGSPPSLPVSVTGCKSHPVANKKVEARSAKLLPAALPPSEPKVAQKLPRSAERRGSAGGTRSPPRRAGQWQCERRRRPGETPGRGGRALVAFLVGRCGGGRALAGEGLAGRGPGDPGTREQSAAAPGEGSVAALLRGSARRLAHCESRCGGGGGRERRWGRGRPPHCEAPAGRAGAARLTD